MENIFKYLDLPILILLLNYLIESYVFIINARTQFYLKAVLSAYALTPRSDGRNYEMDMENIKNLQELLNSTILWDMGWLKIQKRENWHLNRA